MSPSEPKNGIFYGMYMTKGPDHEKWQKERNENQKSHLECNNSWKHVKDKGRAKSKVTSSDDDESKTPAKVKKEKADDSSSCLMLAKSLKSAIVTHVQLLIRR